MIERIISGAQSGVDQGGLLAAYALEILTGGWAPQGWLTESGPEPEFMRQMGLKECLRAGYAARTEVNVREGHGTLIVSPFPALTGGTYMTMCCCESLDKPLYQVWVRPDGGFEYCIDPYRQLKGLKVSRLDLKSWANINDIKVLNVAGPRASKWPEGCRVAYEFIVGSIG